MKKVQQKQNAKRSAARSYARPKLQKHGKVESLTLGHRKSGSQTYQA